MSKSKDQVATVNSGEMFKSIKVFTVTSNGVDVPVNTAHQGKLVIDTLAKFGYEAKLTSEVKKVKLTII